MRLAASLMLLLAGCGAAPSASAVTRHPGDVKAAPAVDVLPSRDAASTPLSERMRFGVLLAEESLGLPSPEPPDQRDAVHLRRWSDTTLASWLQRKSHTVEVARRELDRAADEAHHQRIIAGALVGLMYEDVARALSEVPTPTELESEPDIASMYRDVVDYQASPWREHARAAYDACARNAIEPDHMRHWSVFCAERSERLQPPRMVGPEETTVTVSVDPDAL